MNLFQFPLIALRYRFSFSLVLPITLHMMQNIKILNISNFASGCACDGKESRMGKVQGPASRANARKADGAAKLSYWEPKSGQRLQNYVHS